MNAPRDQVYRVLLEAKSIAQWKVPDGMTCVVHELDPRVGGSFRVSLTYDAPTGTGKTTSHTDTYHGYFKELVPNEKIVEVTEFETANPSLQGEMTITYVLEDSNGGTDLIATHEGLPPGVAPADNELGWSISLKKLKSLVEVPG